MGILTKMAPVRGWKEVKTGGDDRAKLSRSEDWVPGGKGHREMGQMQEE